MLRLPALWKGLVMSARIPDAACYLEPYDEAFLTAVKVIYPQEQRDAAATAKAD